MLRICVDSKRKLGSFIEESADETEHRGHLRGERDIFTESLPL